MDTAHINRLKEHFGFMPINPTENFYEYPCAGTLSNIPKAIQTEEWYSSRLKMRSRMLPPS